ncbi:hypothetical protein K1T35_47675 (plasmid) [Pseudonocardia sp. DSM 110487]|uniref:hypothetical protein n=1 Tax=Pseudonocardia sp. DSM 110487 TaxID=2865833 RepID=UPI001C6A6C59|nr:hypothetical protein [Pseudonocardia sp. DSM 110487]QYN41031.1 hypothetical protein K1T35_47675 [Pseudonocardia sp. DSM 110487]
MSETYAATAVLVAVMGGEIDRAANLLDDLLTSELLSFHDQADLLASLIGDALRRRMSQDG